jgi:hypothetical protein
MKGPPRRRKPSAASRSEFSSREPAESRSSVALTVAWTMAVTTVLMCDAGAVLAHGLAPRQADPRRLYLLGELLLLGGTAAGLLSLGLLPLVRRVRRTPPPQGLVAFSLCAAAAPMLALVLRAVR